jgi:hypothetical protein
MTHLHSAFILLELSVLIASYGYAEGQKSDASASGTQQELSLNRTNDGQHAFAKVGQPIVVGTTTPPKYLPKQSASRVRAPYRQRKRTPVARRRSTVSLLSPRERPESESRTQVQTPLLRLRFRSEKIDRLN